MKLNRLLACLVILTITVLGFSPVAGAGGSGTSFCPADQISYDIYAKKDGSFTKLEHNTSDNIRRVSVTTPTGASISAGVHLCVEGNQKHCTSDRADYKFATATYGPFRSLQSRRGCTIRSADVFNADGAAIDAIVQLDLAKSTDNRPVILLLFASGILLLSAAASAKHRSKQQP